MSEEPASLGGGAGLSLRPYVPEHIVPRLLAGNFPRPGRAEPLSGAVLFSDVSGFTPLSEGLTRLGKEGAERLTVILNRHFARMVEVVESFDGSVVKYAGDAITVLFPAAAGSPIADVVARAVACGVAMQSAISEYARVDVAELRETFTLRMKIGIACGPMNQLVVGDSSSLEYVLAGLPLDEMSGAEHHASAGDVVLAPSAVALSPAETLEPLAEGFARLAGPGPSVPPKILARATRILADEPAFVPFLPAEVVEQIRSTGGALSVGEHRKVTTAFVLFEGIDFDDDPEAFRKLQRYYQHASALVRRFGGRVNRVSTGDKGSLLHILFGAPVGNEDDERRAVLAMMALRDNPLEFPLVQRIGVNTGSAFCGDLGSDRRREYTIMGDAVNLAARLMQAAGPGQILCSEGTVEKTRRDVDYDELPAIRVKGKSAPIVPSVPQRPRSVTHDDEAAAASRLVGRDREIATAMEFAFRAREGKGFWLHVAGEAGVGKTRFAREILARLDSAVPLLRGQGLSHGRDIALHVWSPVVAERLGVPDDAPPSARRAALESAVAARLPDHPEDAGLLGAALGWWSIDQPTGFAAEESLRQQRVFGALEAVLLGGAPAQAILLDDLHWADRTSREFLRWLGGNIETLPLLLLTIGREGGEEPGWRDLPARGSVLLGELDREGIASLAADMLGGGKVDDDLVELLAGRSHGNPLHALELLRHLQSSDGLLYEAETRRWYLAPGLDATVVPETVQDLVLSRIDRLPARTKEILKLASMLGRSFSRGDLEAILPPTLGGAGVAEDLDRLGSLGLSRSGDPACPTFVFDQILLQQVAYDSLTFEQRRSLHAAVGRRLEKEGAAGREALLAHHFVSAGDAARGFRWSRLAGLAAAEGAAHEEAWRHLTRAIELAPAATGGSAEEDLLELLPVRAQVLSQLGQSSEAFADLRETFRLCHRRRDFAAMSRTCWEMSRVEEVRGRYRTARSLARTTTRFAHEAEWPEGVVRGMTQEGNVLGRIGDVTEALRVLTVAMELTTEGTFRGQVLIAFGAALRAAKEFDRAFEVFHQALSHARGTSDAPLELTALVNLAILENQRGRTAEWRSIVEAAGTLATRLGDHRQRLNIVNERALLDLTQGNLSASREGLEEALFLARRFGAQEFEANELLNLSAVTFQLEDFAAARDFATRAQSLFARIGSAEGRLMATATLVEIRQLRNEEGTAEIVEEMARDSAATGLWDLEVWALTRRGEIAGRAGETAEATHWYRTAVEREEQLARPGLAAEARAALESMATGR